MFQLHWILWLLNIRPISETGNTKHTKTQILRRRKKISEKRLTERCMIIFKGRFQNVMDGRTWPLQEGCTLDRDQIAQEALINWARLDSLILG